LLRTKTVDLMELFVQLFDTSSEPESESVSSTLLPPMAELAAHPVPMVDVLGAKGSVLASVLEQYAAQNSPELAEKFSELSRLIEDDEEDLILRDTRAKRLLDFVYPVV